MQPVRPANVPLTYEVYAGMPDDGRRRELIDGDFEMNPAPSTRHQTVSRHLQYELMAAIEEPGHGFVFNAPTDIILSDTNVVQPDLCIVRHTRQHIITERAIEGAPDVMVEILSPGTSTLDRRVKSALYARFAVPEYWIVEPDGARLELHQLQGGAYVLLARLDRASTLETPGFPDVRIDLSRVFR